MDENYMVKPIDKCHETPEELVVKSIAPVKREFLCSPPRRDGGTSHTGGDSLNRVTPISFIKEKLSKRELKKERKVEKHRFHLCPKIAKSGDVCSCPDWDKCRFDHDLETFKTQKPADLDGICPFTNSQNVCPYGLTCRFFGTHTPDMSAETSTFRHKISEFNGLTKDAQRLLWKRKMIFPKADSQLKLLGQLAKQNIKMEGQGNDDNHIIPNGVNDIDADKFSEGYDSCVKFTSTLDTEDSIDGTIGDLSAKISENPMSEFQEKQSDVAEVQITSADTDASQKLHPREKNIIDLKGRLYLAPLTTVGNLPFRRVCKVLGADVTCGEMAVCSNLLQGKASEWALLRRHSSEDLFGVQICGSHPASVSRTVELIEQECTVDFIDINMGCPIDFVVNKGAGSFLLTKPRRMEHIIRAASATMEKPLTIKVRTGYIDGKNCIDSLIADVSNWGASAVTIHGRSRQQRYSKLSNWDYIYDCANKAPADLQVLGNGDIFSYLDWNDHMANCSMLSSCVIARASLVKPWIFTEIKEQRHWDITSGERLNIMKDYVRFGLHHWGSDTKGVETTRRFLLELLSYSYRYIPVGLLDLVPQKLNWRLPSYFGRDDLETLMASDSAADWIRLSEMLLGNVPEGFKFSPKHISNAYDGKENG